MQTLAKVQLGKNGLTEGFFQMLENHFKKHKNVKISVLKSCCREKIALKEISEQILARLGQNYNSKIVGYTINVKKFGKKVSGE